MGDIDYSSKLAIQARDEYKKEFKKIEDRAHRAARMNYHVSSDCERKANNLEYLAAGLSAISITSAFWPLSWPSLLQNGLRQRIFLTAGKLLLVAVALEFVAKGNSNIFPLLSERARAHTRAGAAWQTLELDCRSARIKLDNSAPDVAWCSGLFENLVRRREEICNFVVVPQSYYDQYHMDAKKEA